MTNDQAKNLMLLVYKYSRIREDNEIKLDNYGYVPLESSKREVKADNELKAFVKNLTEKGNAQCITD